MTSLAEKNGLRFKPEGHFRNLCNDLNLMQGRKVKRSVKNNYLYGRYQGHDIMVFDYYYLSHLFYIVRFSFFVLTLPVSLPELLISKEKLLLKMGQSLGYDDIDFESREFSDKFCVRSKNKKFAYDFCNAKMIEYLLKNDDSNIEVENNVLSIFFDHRLEPKNIETNMNRLITIRSLMPEYLFSGR